MQFEELQKLKSLINTSPILSSSERVDWLALLDVMNEKQLLELEKILSGSVVSSKPAASPVPGLNQQSGISEITSPNPSSARRGREQQPQMPKLSHIMNLPNLGSLNQTPKTIVQAQKPPLQTKPSAFDSKLKAIFQEKELPPGNAELELTVGETKNQKPLETLKLKIPKNQDQKIGEEIFRPIFQLKENAPVKPQEIKSEPVVLKVPPPVPPKPKTASFGFVPPPAAPAAPLAPKPAKSPDYRGEPVQIPQKEPTSEKPVTGLENLQDLAAMQSKILQTSSADAIAKKIKPIINKYGYFEAIFNIEKSAAYKDYINTGLKLLSEQSNFENLGEEAGGYLNREQFETFADMLAKIQAS